MVSRNIFALAASTAATLAAVLIATPANAVNAFEKDQAVTVSVSAVPPIVFASSNDAALGIFKGLGDIWFVKDNASDGRSAAILWEDYDVSFIPAKLYRHGSCINSEGSGIWAQCNKNYNENHELAYQVCVYVRESDSYQSCSAKHYY